MGKCIIRETGFHLDKAELLIGSISSSYSYSAPITINKAHILLFRCAPDYCYVKFLLLSVVTVKNIFYGLKLCFGEYHIAVGSGKSVYEIHYCVGIIFKHYVNDLDSDFIKSI